MVLCIILNVTFNFMRLQYFFAVLLKAHLYQSSSTERDRPLIENVRHLLTTDTISTWVSVAPYTFMYKITNTYTVELGVTYHDACDEDTYLSELLIRTKMSKAINFMATVVIIL